jgi:hypothetical protein
MFILGGVMNLSKSVCMFLLSVGMVVASCCFTNTAKANCKFGCTKLFVGQAWMITKGGDGYTYSATYANVGDVVTVLGPLFTGSVQCTRWECKTTKGCPNATAILPMIGTRPDSPKEPVLVTVTDCQPPEN